MWYKGKHVDGWLGFAENSRAQPQRNVNIHAMVRLSTGDVDNLAVGNGLGAAFSGRAAMARALR
jgi:hypothetical protein